ncbi:MAG: hypothetical protein ACO34E_12445, partial [Limisphaerales bacterium]
EARYVEEEMVVDGRLEESFWSGVEVGTGFLDQHGPAGVGADVSSGGVYEGLFVCGGGVSGHRSGIVRRRFRRTAG